jgi:uncharacterized protein (TIGR02145 family)
MKIHPQQQEFTMKTNRFLSLAAALGFALAFTFSCSGGDDPPSGGNTYECDGNEYNPSTHFCSNNTAYAKCGGYEYNPSTHFCSDNIAYTKCDGNEYIPSTHFCSNNTAYAKCEGNEYNPSTHLCENNILYTSFTDTRDNKKYKTVEIGRQTWMAENLNYNAMYSKCYSDDPANCDKYGRLYDWPTAMANSASSAAKPSGVKGVCPTGWHLPSDAEWTTLENYVGTDSGTKLKAKNGWENNGNGTDSYNFSALPGGVGISDGSILGISDGSFLGVGIIGDWWSATSAYDRYIYDDDANVYRGDYNDKYDLFSVRCVQD